MIGIFDSGIGGLSVYREIYRLMPDESYIYYSDNAHCPYGEKSKEYIIERARYITELLLQKGTDIIVIACNTATAAAISTLRSEYSDRNNPETARKVTELTGGRRDHVMFIGMEPAVKPAIGLTRTGTIGVLATAGTLKAEKYRHTKELAEGRVTVAEHIGMGFVELVESGITSGPEAERIVRESLVPLLEKGADTIVLGCTHYPFLLGTISKIAGDSVRIVNPAPAVARHLAEVMEQDGIARKDGVGSGDTVLMASGSDSVLRKTFANLLTTLP